MKSDKDKCQQARGGWITEEMDDVKDWGSTTGISSATMNPGDMLPRANAGTDGEAPQLSRWKRAGRRRALPFQGGK